MRDSAFDQEAREVRRAASVTWCLHGFLGRPSDWNVLPFSHRAVDLFAGEFPEPGPDDALVGYSMGGRLALKLLEETPIRRAVIISAGLNSPAPERVARDEEWARRFESESWDSLIEAWNAQSVFHSTASPSCAETFLRREERDYDRAVLAHTLRAWSTAVLPPPKLESIETPILWIAGERDERYVEIAESAVRRLPNAELWICPRAGHRVPWEEPAAFIARLRQFLDLH